MLAQRINSPLTLFRRILTPASVVDGSSLIGATGTKLFCKTALQPFKVKLDNGEQFDFAEGFSYEMAEGDYFSSLELTNPQTAALIVELYVGNARVFRAAPLHFRAAASALVPAAGTFAGTYGGSGVGGMTGANGVTFVGTATSASKYANKNVPVGARRKQFVVSNRGTTDIFISDTSGNVFGVCMSDDDYTLETDADFKVWGTSGAGYYIAETFYL
jgi:hypothetical protein